MGDMSARPLRPGRLAAELIIIFVGVTAAFFVENYREEMAAEEDLRQASEGIVEELRHYATRGLVHADSFTASIEAWRAADRAGRRAVPHLYRMPGSPSPPPAAWDATVASGVASQFAPDLRFRLGYFYDEMDGIHVNYGRQLAFIESEVMPRAEIGPGAFYDATGRFDPAVRVRIDLLDEFADDLRRLSTMAGELADELEAAMEPS